jgi:hypothetical protein
MESSLPTPGSADPRFLGSAVFPWDHRQAADPNDGGFTVLNPSIFRAWPRPPVEQHVRIVAYRHGGVKRRKVVIRFGTSPPMLSERVNQPRKGGEGGNLDCDEAID